MTDWNAPPDGDTPEEMQRVLEQRRAQEEHDAFVDDILWRKLSGHYGYDGHVVIPIRQGPTPEDRG